MASLHPQRSVLLNDELIKVCLQVLGKALPLFLKQLLVLHKLLVENVLSFLLGLANMADQLLMSFVQELEPWQQVPIELGFIVKFLGYEPSSHVIEFVILELTRVSFGLSRSHHEHQFSLPFE